MKRLATLLLALAGCLELSAQDTLLSRRYREGESLTYRMTGSNEGWRYQLQASGVVKKDAAGIYTEEYRWSDLVSNRAAGLSARSAAFRQILSLDPQRIPALPDLSQADIVLIGPITDFMTFYADLWLASQTGKLAHAGDRVYQKHGTPASWADGVRVLTGEDSIDFDILLKEVDDGQKIATLLVRHVPPEQPQVKLPAAWMEERVADTANNWVQVAKRDGKYVAAVGKESFDVELKVSLADGKILSGTLDNPIELRERDCADEALTSCGAPRIRKIRRQVEISLIP